MRTTLDIIVMALAAIAAVSSFDYYLKARRKNDKHMALAKFFTVVLFIVCQSSWLMASLAGLGMSPETTNWAWDIFNASVMGIFIASSWTKAYR